MSLPRDLLVLVALAVAAAPAAAAAPDGWTCNEAYYDAGDGCDCGCGVVDADCADGTLESCDFGLCPAGQTVDPADTAQCLAIPDAWGCLDTFFADGVCDCGCREPDLDCADPSDASLCAFDNCTLVGLEADPSDPTECIDPNQPPPEPEPEPVTPEPPTAAPEGWTCNETWLGDGTCDCGCGAADTDCADPTDASACTYDNCGYLGLIVDENDPTQCVQGDEPPGPTPEPDPLEPGDPPDFDIPSGWECPDFYVGDGQCDCGCGALDSDCPDASVTSCDYDNCAAAGETADPYDPTQCVAADDGEDGAPPPGPGAPPPSPDEPDDAAPKPPREEDDRGGDGQAGDDEERDGAPPPREEEPAPPPTAEDDDGVASSTAGGVGGEVNVSSRGCSQAGGVVPGLAGFALLLLAGVRTRTRRRARAGGRPTRRS